MKIIGYLAVISCLMFVLFNYLNIFFDMKISKRNLKYLLIYIIICTGIIALVTKPYIGDDLTRHFSHIDNFREYRLSYLDIFPYKNEYIILLIYLIISMTNLNNLLPFFVTTLFYLSCLLFYKKILKENFNLKYFSIYIIILISFVYLNEIISGVRYPLAIAIFLLIFINDKNKNKTYNLLYILPIFAHPATIVLSFIAIISKFEYNFNIKKIGLFIAILPYICLCISFFIPDNIIFISNIFERLQIYSNPNFYLTFFDLRVQICFISIFCIILFLYYIKFRDSNNKINNIFDKFYFLLSCFCIGVLPFPIIFNRYMTPIIILSLPYFQNLQLLSPNKKKIITFVITIICIGLFAYRMVNAYHYWRFY